MKKLYIAALFVILLFVHSQVYAHNFIEGGNFSESYTYILTDNDFNFHPRSLSETIYIASIVNDSYTLDKDIDIESKKRLRPKSNVIQGYKVKNNSSKCVEKVINPKLKKVKYKNASADDNENIDIDKVDNVKTLTRKEKRSKIAKTDKKERISWFKMFKRHKDEQKTIALRSASENIEDIDGGGSTKTRPVNHLNRSTVKTDKLAENDRKSAVKRKTNSAKSSSDYKRNTVGPKIKTAHHIETKPQKIKTHMAEIKSSKPSKMTRINTERTKPSRVSKAKTVKIAQEKPLKIEKKKNVRKPKIKPIEPKKTLAILPEKPAQVQPQKLKPKKSIRSVHSKPEKTEKLAKLKPIKPRRERVARTPKMQLMKPPKMKSVRLAAAKNSKIKPEKTINEKPIKIKNKRLAQEPKVKPLKPKKITGFQYPKTVKTGFPKMKYEKTAKIKPSKSVKSANLKPEKIPKTAYPKVKPEKISKVKSENIKQSPIRNEKPVRYANTPNETQIPPVHKTSDGYIYNTVQDVPVYRPSEQIYNRLPLTRRSFNDDGM